jgi:hypothetical protein
MKRIHDPLNFQNQFQPDQMPIAIQRMRHHIRSTGRRSETRVANKAKESHCNVPNDLRGHCHVLAFPHFFRREPGHAAGRIGF